MSRVLLIGMVIFATGLFAQEASISEEKQDSLSTTVLDIKFKKALKTGNQLFEEGSYYNASTYYEAAIMQTKKKKKLMYLNYQLGECNFNMRDYPNAASYYSKTIALDKKQKYFLAQYQLANAQKHQAKYQSAKINYQKFLSDEENNSKADYEKKRARLEIKGCEYGDTLNIDDPQYEVNTIGNNVNGPFSDFGPEIVDGALLFSKIKSDNAIVLKEEMKEDYYARIYTAKTNENGFDEATVFSKNLAEEGVYVGNPSMSNDGKTLYFTKCKLVAELNTECNIYRSKWENGEWSDATALGDNINQENTNSTHPQIVIDEKGNTMLYFVSDKPRSRGGKDIWIAQMNEDGTFDKAKNAGYPINTIYDEVSPHYVPSEKTLYFSSNGHISLGGYDIFKSVKNEDGDWMEEVNMGTPLNTSLDDYDFVFDEQQDLGYLVSNRIGTTSYRSETCCDDIFEVRKAKVEIYITGLVFAANANGNRALVDEADVVLISENDLERVTTSGDPFYFLLEKNKEYTLTGKSQDFKRVEIPINTSGMNQSDTLYQDIVLKDRDLEYRLIGSIYYEFDLSKLRADAPDTLRKVLAFMNAYPMTIVEVGAHTDSKGSDEYNQNLSVRRSAAALNYLVSQGINKKRLVQKSYGESQPVAPNTNEDGSDNEEGRALNRRTEFKVVGKLSETESKK